MKNVSKLIKFDLYELIINHTKDLVIYFRKFENVIKKIVVFIDIKLNKIISENLNNTEILETEIEINKRK
jgi:hypothetical protein